MLYLRPSSGLQPTDLFVHGGQGVVDVALRAVIENYPEYRHLRADGLGYFAISTFGTVGGIHEQEIVRRLPHGSYGVARASLVMGSYQVLPTSDDDETLHPEIRWLQPYHFDICLPDPPDDRLRRMDPLDDELLLSRCEEHLAVHAGSLLALFSRVQKA